MTTDTDLLRHAGDLAIDYTAQVDERAAAATPEAIAALAAFDEPLPDDGADATETIDLLAEIGGAATVASTGPDYYGFVTGATYPAALGASFIADAWDQNAALPAMSPIATGWSPQLITRTWNRTLCVPGATSPTLTLLGIARMQLCRIRPLSGSVSGLSSGSSLVIVSPPEAGMSSAGV